MQINRRAFLGTVVVAVGVSGMRAGNRLAPVARGAARRAASLRAAASPVPVASAIAMPLDAVKVVAVHPITHGGLPVVLEHEGHLVQVDVLRRDAVRAAGVVETEHLSLFVHNGGDGSAATGRERELAARSLAIALENDGSAQRLAPALLTFAQRADQFPDGNFRAASTGTV